jgi:hypothetical protein
MVNYRILFFLILCSLGEFESLFCQDVKFLNQKMIINETYDRVDIYYDLISSNSDKTFHITADLYLNGKKISGFGLSGDIGMAIQPGINKKIIWDVKKDLDFLSGDLKVLIYENNPNPKEIGNEPCPRKIGPVIVGFGSIFMAGSALSNQGIKLFNQSYKWYKEIYVPEPSLVQNQEFQKYKNQFSKVSPLLMISGTSLISTAILGMGFKILRIRSLNKRCLQQSKVGFKQSIFINSVINNNFQSQPIFTFCLNF